ncbi:site-specific DNA-methyltransferase [Lactobacillus amylovorus]|uniref:Methyltransferase n=1 Tax=Lactobacillus amylovorus TaxID=1604 RepID=A0A9X3W6L5_LACAM|nr:site-specific DNA-methyltransferase [Lactobacillus amylovorus]MDB6261160.1 site-specific DNA-methyltransferase [Lactobacillus amylovorus]
MTETLLQGDCLELLPTIQDNSIDLILADLPYGTTANKWDSVIPFAPLWDQYMRIIKDHGVIALFGDEPFASALRLSNKKYYRYDWIWVKSIPTGFLNANRMPMKNTETISIFYKHLPLYHPQMSKGKPHKVSDHGPSTNYGHYRAKWKTADNKGTRYPVKTIKFANSHNTVHPTQKPVSLLQYLIKTYTDEGMTVLDNCMGSGSTGVAAKQLNRNFIGMELDKEYFEIAKQRIKEA